MSVGRADVHIHTMYSDGLLEPEDAVNYAVTQTNLRLIAITDHNTLDGARQAYDYWKHHRDAFGQIEVIIGEEVSSTDGHILGLFLHETVPPHMSPADTIAAIHEQGGVAIAAHPFTHLLPFSDLKGIGTQIGDLPLDGVEVRNSVPIEVYSNLYTDAFNRQHRQHTPIGGSDCHYLPMLGRTFTYFDGHTPDELKTAILSRTARPGGFVNGPGTVAQFVRDMLRMRRLPFIMPNDHLYRHSAPDLTVEVEELRGLPVTVLHCRGKILRANADMLKAQALNLLEGGLVRIVVDLEYVAFVDSAGMGALVAIQKRAKASGGEVALARISEGIRLSLQLVRLDKVLGIYQTQSEAVTVLVPPR